MERNQKIFIWVAIGVGIALIVAALLLPAQPEWVNDLPMDLM